MVEKSDVVEECSSCVRFEQEMEIARKDQAATLKMIKEKIMSTDKLIKKYQKKCDDFDKQAKKLNDLTAKHENCERNTAILQEQLSHSLEVTEPQKKTITRLIQEKFVAEETIQELKQKNLELEEVINHLKHGIQLRDEKDSSWKLEQQLQAKQIEKDKKRVEKLTKELEKAKEDIKQGKALMREQNRGLRACERKCNNFEFQVNKLKEELKYARKNGGLLYQRKSSPRELNMTRTTRQSLKRCEEKLDEILSDSNKECKSPEADERPALTSIFDEMTNIADYPLSPVPPSPTESQDSSSESSDHSSGSGTDSDGESLGDLGNILELSLKNKNTTSLENGTVDNSSFDWDAGEGLDTESGDEDTENNSESVYAAKDDKNPGNSEQIIQKVNNKETIHDSYQEKEQNAPEKIQSEEHVRKTSVSEYINSKYKCSLSVTSVISSDEVTSVATSKVPSDLGTGDSTAESMDTNENTLEVVGSETTSIDKVPCESFEKETIEEVDIENNNLSSTSLKKDLTDSLSVIDTSENDITNNTEVTCSENTGMSITDIPNNVGTESVQEKDSGKMIDTCGPVGGAVLKASGEKMLSENNVESLDLDKSEAKDEFKNGVDEFADRITKVLPGKRDDEGIDMQDNPVTDNIQPAENNALLSAENQSTSKRAEYANMSMEIELKDGDKDDSLPNDAKIIKYSFENIEESLEDILPEHQKHEKGCDMGNKVDEDVDLLDENLDDFCDEEISSSAVDDAYNWNVENLCDKIHTFKQTSRDTKGRERSNNPSENNEIEKICSLPHDDKVLEHKKEVVSNNVKRTKRNNPEISDNGRKRHKRVATLEMGATPTNVNRTPPETMNESLEGTQEELIDNQSAEETNVDEKENVSVRIPEHDGIHSNDNTTSNRDAKSSITDDSAKKCHLDLTEFSSELLNVEENVALEESKLESVDNKVVLHSSNLTKSCNKVEGDSSCLEISSFAVIEEGTEEVLEEGGTDEVVDTIASVIDVEHDALVLEHHSGKRIMDFEASTLVDAVDPDSNDEKSLVDTHQSDFTIIKKSIDTWDKAKSKSNISDPSIPSLSLSSVLNDSFHVFGEEIPLISPLPPSPISSRKSSPDREFNTEEHAPSLFTSLPTLEALKPLFHTTSLVGASRVSSAPFVSQASIAAKRHGPPAEYKHLEPLKKIETPRQDTADDLRQKQVKELKVNKHMTKKLTVRPSFFTETKYVDKVLRYLSQEHAEIDDAVCRLSNTKTMSSGMPIATALAKFQHSEDLMPTIIQKYHDRDRQHQEQSSRQAHLNNWTPVLSVFEDQVSLVVIRLSQVEHLKGLSTKVISLLSSAIIHSCSAADEPDKRCIASHCRLVCSLCRSESNLQHMRVLCSDIIRSLYSRPGTVFYLMISIAAVWPAVLVSSASVSTTSKGFVCLAGESYLPLPCTIQMLLTTWARTYGWVLLGNVLDWLCAWKQLPSGVLLLEQLVGELVRIMKDPSFAQLMCGKDGNQVLAFGLYEVIKALELVSCVLGWAWLNNVLVRGYLWDILTRWINKIQAETKCSDVMTPCLELGKSCHNDSKPLSRSVDQKKEDLQRMNHGTGDTNSGIDVVQNEGSESLSTFVNQDKEHKQSPDVGDTRNSNDVLHNDPQLGQTDQVPEPTAVAAIRLLGLVCRIAVQHYQKIPQVIPLLVGLLQTTQDCPVPYAVQLASAYSLLEVSPWQPSTVISVLDEWKAVQDTKSKTLPASLIQGLNSLRICLEPGKHASVLFEGCTRMLEDNDDGDIERKDEG